MVQAALKGTFGWVPSSAGCGQGAAVNCRCGVSLRAFGVSRVRVTGAILRPYATGSQIIRRPGIDSLCVLRGLASDSRGWLLPLLLFPASLEKGQSLGRVGERATHFGATHSPLIEPDKRISRHPALLKTYCRRLAQAVDGGQPYKRTSPKRWICS